MLWKKTFLWLIVGSFVSACASGNKETAPAPTSEPSGYQSLETQEPPPAPEPVVTKPAAKKKTTKKKNKKPTFTK